MTSAYDIIRTARAAVGVPYKSNGRKIRVGLDCAGLVLMVAKTFGISVPCPPTDYARAHRLDYVLDQMKRNFDRIPSHFAKPGMVVVMRPGQSLAHLGIIDTMATVIEATNEPDLMRVVRRRVDWSTVRGVFAYQGVEY